MSQKQRSERVYYGSQVSVKARNRPNESGFVKNLSEGGVFLLSSKKYLSGTELTVFLPIDLGEKKSLCMVSGKVIRVESGKNTDQIQGYGVQFDTNLPKASVQMIQDFVVLKKTGKAPDRKKVQRVSSNRD